VLKAVELTVLELVVFVSSVIVHVVELLDPDITCDVVASIVRKLPKGELV